MRKMDYKRVIIMSAEDSQETFRENRLRTHRLMRMLEDVNIAYDLGLGSYLDRIETALVIVPNSLAEIELVRDFAFKSFKQESISVQDNRGDCVLEYNDGTVETLGRLKATPKRIAQKQQNYTLFKDVYYTIGA
jgi:hypothetical protein